MFTKIKIENFRSFKNIEFNLAHKTGDSKKLAIVYGENGAGKSNLLAVFSLLNDLLHTMDVRDMYEDFLKQKPSFNNTEIDRVFQQNFFNSLRDMQTIINSYKMVGNTESIKVEYEFAINGNLGTYQIELGEDEIISEKLEYLITKRKGICFNCTKNNININNTIFNKNFLKNLYKTAEEYWGKHSLFAIIQHEFNDKSKTYVDNSVSDNFSSVMDFFRKLSCFVNLGEYQINSLTTPFKFVEQPINGSVNIHDEKILDFSAELFTKYFSAMNSNFKKAYYKKSNNGEMVDFQLYFEKIVAGQLRQIPFRKESTGNQQLLYLLCKLLSACFGGVVVIDEADANIHDVLFMKIVNEINSLISGQIILSTHNTILMETEFARGATYILTEEKGKIIVQCVNNYKKRIQVKHNIRSRYLNNELGGIPKISSFEFTAMMDYIENNLLNVGVAKELQG